MFRTFTLVGMLAIASCLVLGTRRCTADEPKPGDASKSAPAANPHPLVGTWKLDVERNPEFKGDADRPNQVTLICEADSWKLTIVNEGGTQEFVGGYFADDKQTPATLDVTVRGDNDTSEVFAIYKIEKKRLTVAWRQDGVRPSDFGTTPPADGFIRASLVRESEE